MAINKLGLVEADTAQYEDLSRKIRDLTRQVGSLTNVRETGGSLFYGGSHKTGVEDFGYVQGPFNMNLDADFPIDTGIWVPDYYKKIMRCQLLVTPRPFRFEIDEDVVVEFTSSGGGTSGAPSPTSVGAGTNHNHPDTFDVETGGSHSHDVQNATDAADGTGSHAHGLGGAGNAATDNEPAHDHTLSGSVSNESSHTHSMQSHTHTTPNHLHTAASVEISSGIIEEGMATQMRIVIDGVDRSAALGGPFDAAVLVDITQWLVDVRLDPILGYHTLSLESDTKGAIEWLLEWYVVTKPIQQRIVM